MHAPLPLLHCQAIGCLELPADDSTFCEAHHRMAQLLIAREEGLLPEGDYFPADPFYATDADHLPISPDASQEFTPPENPRDGDCCRPQDPVPGDAGNRKESHS